MADYTLSVDVTAFQSTLPREERHYFLLYCRLYTIFQSTLPREERHFSLHVVSSISIFQSTLPREERPKFSDFFPILLIYFNPRSHERSDVLQKSNILYIIISIHAPTRGATLLQLCTKQLFSISIHAPTRGATKTEV